MPDQSDTTLDETFLADVLHGLSQPEKSLPCKYFYDDKGSALFEQVTRLPEYYPSRVEHALLKETAPEIAMILGANPCIIEYGAGALVKIRTLLNAIAGHATYIPIDVSGPFLRQAAAQLNADYPDCDIRPVEGRFFDADLTLPLPETAENTMAFFPGSTLGNFKDDDIVRFLKIARTHVGARGHFLLGVDINQDADSLVSAYNDSAGVTAAFNLNLLTRINRELSANFDLSAFQHEAVWNTDLRQIEMYLISLKDQTVHLKKQGFHIAAGERIHTENSRKFTEARLKSYAFEAGWTLDQTWTSHCNRMGLFLLT
ncbi:MAG: L-histidine N(alpha)-methyltransferase [Pseudomonadota bacterium]